MGEREEQTIGKIDISKLYVYWKVLSIMGKSVTLFLFARVTFEQRLEGCLGSEGTVVLAEERVWSVRGAPEKPAQWLRGTVTGEEAREVTACRPD